MSESNILVLVGARLREIRKQRHLSQMELAEMAGTQDTYIGGVERGERNISLLTLERITTALGVSIQDVFQFGNIQNVENVNDKSVVIEILSAQLAQRYYSEVMLVKRILDDLFQTIDEDLHK